MVEHLRLVTALHFGANHKRSNPSSANARNLCATAIIGVGAFIPNDEQETVSARLKLRASQYFWDLLREPCIGLRKRPIVRVVRYVWGNEGVVWGGVVSDIFRELRERDAVQLLTGSADVDEIYKGVVAAKIASPTESRKAGVGQVFLVTLPRHAMQQQMADDVINVVAGGGVVPKSHTLASADAHHVGKRVVNVGIVLRRDGILFGERVEIRHIGVADNLFIAVILLGDDPNVVRLRNCARRSGQG